MKLRDYERRAINALPGLLLAKRRVVLVGEEQGSDPEDFEDASIAELPQVRAEKIQFALDGHSLWEEFRLSDVEPRVLGCSEWP